MDKKPTVSIVVLNWNGKKFIDLFVPSALNQTYPKDKYEIVFTDNDSTDNSVDYLKKSYSNNNIRVVRNKKNYGYAGGNNLGIKTCAKDYILVCNNDLKLDPNLIENMVATAISRDADVVVPKLMFLKNKRTINNAGSWIDENSNWPIYETGANEPDSGQYDTEREITAFCGACVLFKRSFLQNVGLYDNRFFMYFEDGDLSWRGQKQNKTYYYCPSAVAYHYHTGSSKEGSPLFNYFVGRNRILILTKNGKIRPLLSCWKVSLYENLYRKIVNILNALRGKYSKRLAIIEAKRSMLMLLSAVTLTPYAVMKRIGIIKEDRLS